MDKKYQELNIGKEICRNKLIEERNRIIDILEEIADLNYKDEILMSLNQLINDLYKMNEK